MRFRAIAMASERSNAVGTVELECAPTGLSLVYLEVGGFTEGYVSANQAQGEKLLVPWPQLVEASVDGEQVFLSLGAGDLDQRFDAEPARMRQHLAGDGDFVVLGQMLDHLERGVVERRQPL